MSLFRIVDRDGEMLSEADSLDRVPRLSAALLPVATMSTRFPRTRSHRDTRPGAGAAPYAMRTVA